MTTSIFKGDSPPITSREDLLSYFRAGEKPREQWRIGTEHEKLGFFRDTLQPVPYEGERGIRTVMQQLANRFGWEEVLEDGNLIALLRGQCSITLEPGGQFELSGAPLMTTHDACPELDAHLSELREISEPLGIAWLAIGRNPLVASSAMPWMPKQRYRIMKSYLPTRSASALDMMVGTGTVQVNLDYASERDMREKIRLAMALSPFFTALFANSPFEDGKPSGFVSTRSHVWLRMEPDRSGILTEVFNDDFGYEDYTEYALDVPMFFIHRDERYLDYSGISFRKYLEEGLEGHVATQRDWELHLTTLFPEVRLKKYIELRMADVGNRETICAFVALTRGLFYDDTARDAACHIISRLRPGDIAPLQREAARLGLRAMARGRSLQAWWAELLPLARDGLRRLNAKNSRGQTEEGFLEVLEEIVDSGMTQADRLLELWEGPWKHDIRPVLQAAEIR